MKTVGVILSSEEARNAGLVIGSLGRGSQDEWSDLDLLIFTKGSTLIENLPEWTTRFGRVLRVGEAPPQNAPQGGRQLTVWYDIGTTMPLLVDWNVWPLVFAAQPHDTRLWFNRTDQPLGDPDATFDAYASSLPRVDTPIREHSPEELRRYRFSMVPVAAKYIARRDAHRTTLAFALIGLPVTSDDPHDQVAVLRELFENVSLGESEEVTTAVRRMLRFVVDRR